MSWIAEMASNSGKNNGVISEFGYERGRMETFCKLHPDSESLKLGLLEWDKKEIDIRDISFIAEKYSQLRSLSLTNLNEIYHIFRMPYLSAVSIDFGCLEFLHVSNCPNLETFRVGAPLLRRLEVFDNVALASIHLRVPFSTQIVFRTSLPKFDIDRIPLEDSDLKLIKDDPYEAVKFLDLSYCGRITDVGLTHLVQMPLKKLSLRGCRKQPVDNLFRILGSHTFSPLSRNLEELDLGDFLVFDQGKQLAVEKPSIPVRWNCPRLTHLDLSDNLELTRAHLVRLFHVRLGLNSFSVSNCPKLDAFGFLPFQYLCALRADNLPLLTDEGLKNLKDHPLLKLSIAKCKQITDAGLKTLEPIKTLRMLKVKGCPLVTLRGVRSLTEAIPGIQIFHDLDSTTH